MKFCPYCGADLIEDAVLLLALNAENSFLQVRRRKKNLRKSQKSIRLLKRRKRNLPRRRRTAARSKLPLMMDMTVIMMTSARLMKAVSAKASIKSSSRRLPLLLVCFLL